MEDDQIEALTYLPTTPDMTRLKISWDGDVIDSQARMDQIAIAADRRNCRWPNKSSTQRKDHRGAKPWVGASDQEVPMIEYACDTLVTLGMQAYDNGDFSGIPIGSDDIERSAVVSQFIRWQMTSQVKNARQEVETAFNYLTEKAEVAVWVGYEKKQRRHQEEFTIEDIAEISVELAESIMDEDTPDQEIFDMLERVPNIKSVPKAKARKAIKEFRKTGVASIPVLKTDVSRPIILTKEINSEVIMPFYTTDPQKSDRISVKFFYSPQALLEKVWSEKWDQGMVDEIIENHMGITALDFEGGTRRRGRMGANNTGYSHSGNDAEDIAMIVRTYQRFVDPIDGATGIYETVWCPKMGSTRINGDEAFLKFGLLNGWDEYPIAFQRWKEANKRWGDIRGITDSLSGTQRQAKVTRDGTVDQTSLTSSPPRTHRAGAPVQRWGADADIPIRRGDEGLYKYLEVPDSRRDNVALEVFLNDELDRYMGFTENSPIALQKQQGGINKCLSLLEKIAKLVYKTHQKYGEDELIFRITGSPDPITMNKSPSEEELDVKIVFDSRTTQPDYTKDIMEGLQILVGMDRTGRLDPDAITDIATATLLPSYTGRLLRTTGEAQEDIIKRIKDDLGSMALGIPVNADTTGIDVAIPFLEQWEQSPRGQAMLQDELFFELYETYKGQYTLEAQQRDNAQTGAGNNPNAVIEAGQ